MLFGVGVKLDEVLFVGGLFCLAVESPAGFVAKLHGIENCVEVSLFVFQSVVGEQGTDCEKPSAAFLQNYVCVVGVTLAFKEFGIGVE